MICPERIVLIVLDSNGVGEFSDAISYSDVDADTIGHIFDKSEKSFSLSNMSNLGLYELLGGRDFLSCEDVVGCYCKRHYDRTLENFRYNFVLSFSCVSERVS